MRKFASLLAITAALALGACQQEAKAPDSAQTAAPDAKPGLVATDGKLLLPVVKGNPAAAYFTLFNGGDKAATLAAVSIDGAAKSEMHETKGGTMSPVAAIELQPGETVKFERGGRHIMAFDLADKVTAGGAAELTLTFADGDKASVPLMVESMADMDDDDDASGHGDMH